MFCLLLHGQNLLLKFIIPGIGVHTHFCDENHQKSVNQLLKFAYAGHELSVICLSEIICMKEASVLLSKHKIPLVLAFTT